MSTHHERVQAVFQKHLGVYYEDANEISIDAALFLNLIAYTHVAPSVPAIDCAAETVKLERLERAAREIAAAWLDLHPSTMVETVRASEIEDFRRTGNEGQTLGFLHHLPEIIKAGIAGDAGSRSYVNSVPADRGRRKVRNVAAVQGARVIWEKRTPFAAPRHAKEASPFGTFLADLLEAVDGGNAQAALRAWRAYSSDENSG